jgi:hypothetical protein
VVAQVGECAWVICPNVGLLGVDIEPVVCGGVVGWMAYVFSLCALSVERSPFWCELAILLLVPVDLTSPTTVPASSGDPAFVRT